MIYPGQRASVPWGELAGPAEALLWFRGAQPASRTVRLPLARRLACFAACQARLEVAGGGRGQMTLATALYGWPDDSDFAAMGEIEDDELAVLATRFGLERPTLIDAMRAGG